MFKNYILITLRNLWKNKLFVITNILGLGIAIACCIVAYLNYEFNSEFNAFHENGEKIFKVNCFRNVNGNELKYVTKCIKDNWISGDGPFVKIFENTVSILLPKECQ